MTAHYRTNQFKDLLNLSFENYKPRNSFFLKKSRPTKYQNGEGFNIVGYKNIETSSFFDLWKEFSGYEALEKQLSQCYESAPTTSDSKSFVTFSSNLLGHNRCPAHVHNYFNDKPCLTVTFAIPLLNCEAENYFFYSNVSKKWPPRYYIEPNRIPQDIDYNRILLSNSKITKLEFNSSHLIHWTNYTDSVFAFLVIDNVDLNSSEFNHSVLEPS